MFTLSLPEFAKTRRMRSFAELTKIPIATLLFVAPIIYKPFALIALVLLAAITFETVVGGLDTALSQRQEKFRNIESKITNKLTKEGFYAFTNATKTQEELRNKAKEVDQDYQNSEKTAVDKSDRETALEPLLQEFQRLELARRDFKESFTMNIGLLSQEEQVKYEQAARLNLESTGKDFTNQDVRVEAEKIWQEETKLAYQAIDNKSDIQIYYQLYTQTIT